MTRDDLTSLKTWFSVYCKSFYSSDRDYQKNITLKEQHTYKVCENSVRIAEAVFHDSKKIVLAEAIGLFHDIGRFLQYKRYRTFVDRVSVNHGLLGATILLDEKILGNLSSSEREIILQAVKFHNAFSVPDLESQDALHFVKLIRDADKLDIWRVFIEYYAAPSEEKASAVSLGLPDTSGYSREVLSCFHEKRIASLRGIKTLNDFKLMQLSWIFDLNFPPSLTMLLERNYVEKLASSLPQTGEILNVVALLQEYVQDRLHKEREAV